MKRKKPTRYDFHAEDQRVIGVLDLDAFYCQVTEKNHPELKGKPVGIKQKYLIVTCNYEARAFGVGKLMMIEEARKRCPDLIIMDGSDLTPFRNASAEINSIWESFGAPVERLGMDESFLDLTQLVEQRLHSSSSSEDFSFEGHVEGNEGELCVGLRKRLAIGSHIIKEMRDTLFKALGFRCCGGVSISKLSAKLAAELRKPNQQSTLLPTVLPSFLEDVKLTRIQGIGRQQIKKLHAAYLFNFPESMDLESAYDLTCKHVRRIPFLKLCQGLGENEAQACVVYERVRGIDRSQVVASGGGKSISQEETSLPHPDTLDAARARLLILCERLLVLVNARRTKDGELPTTLRVSVTDKGDQIVLARRDRMHRSRQMSVDGIVFSTVKSLFAAADGLLVGCLVPNQKFLLCRVNLGVSDFVKVASTKNQAISTFFQRKEVASLSQPANNQNNNNNNKHSDNQNRHGDNKYGTSQDDIRELEKKRRKEEDESASGALDPSVLACLPAELREEVLANWSAHSRGIVVSSASKRVRKGTLDTFFSSSSSSTS